MTRVARPGWRWGGAWFGPLPAIAEPGDAERLLTESRAYRQSDARSTVAVMQVDGTGCDEVVAEIDHIEGLRSYLNMLLLLSLIGCVFGIASFGILCWLGFGG